MREKPSFQTGGAYWVNPEYLPPALVKTLKKILLCNSKIKPNASVSFLQRCHIEAQFIHESLASNSKAETRDQLTQLATKTAALIDAMDGLTKQGVEWFNLRFDDLAFCSDPPVVMAHNSRASRRDVEGGRFLGAVWDTLIDLEVVANRAASELQPDRSDQVTNQNAGRLIWNICESYRLETGTLPPYSKDTWFPEFMAALGQWRGLRLPCGRARIETVVRVMRDQLKQGKNTPIDH